MVDLISIGIGAVLVIFAFEYGRWRERTVISKKEKENKINDHTKNLMIDFSKWILGAPIGGGIGGSRSPCRSIESFERSEELIEHLKNYPEFWNIRKEALKLIDNYNNQIEETFKDIEETFINLIKTAGISIQTYYIGEAIRKPDFYNPEKLGLILRAHIRQGKELVPFKVIKFNGKYCVCLDKEENIIAESNEKVKAESISRIANQVSKIYYDKLKIIEFFKIESDKLCESFDKEMSRLARDVENGFKLKGKCRVCKVIYSDC